MIRILITVALVSLLSSCAMQKVTSQAPLLGIDGKTCVGNIITPPEALVEVKDDVLLQSALDTSEKGKLCAGKVFAVQKPVTVYRVWDSSKPYTLYGGWWSLSIPQGPRQKYQKENDICPSWSALDRMSQCTLKVGAHVVIGPGQSAMCETELYPASPINQVYVANDGLKKVLWVEQCSDGAVWP